MPPPADICLTPPPPLQAGAAVRVISCSGPLTAARLEAGLQGLRALGLQPRCDPGVLAAEHYLAGSDARRAAELQAALQEPQTQAIWVARGGYGAARMVSDIAPQAVAAARKWLVGYSDVTVLHALWARAGLQSLHAVNLGGLPEWSAAAQQELLAQLGPRPPSLRLPVVRLGGAALPPGGSSRGVLLGGNLTVLASLCGSGLLPSFNDAVVFLEDVGEAPYRLDRALTQLRLGGAFQGARAVLVGQLTRCPAPKSGFGSGCEAMEAIAAALLPTGLPVGCGLPMGHDPTARALPLGRPVHVDWNRGEVRLDAG